MKKVIILVLSVIMLLVLSLTTVATTLPVAVEEGFSIGLGKQLSPASDDIELTGSYGLNENMLVSLSYYTPSGALKFGGRYAFSEDAALVASYLTQSVSGITLTEIIIGGRYKLNLNEQFAIVGEVDLVSEIISVGGLSATGSLTNIIAQAEYKIGDMVMVNGGVEMLNGEGLSSTAFKIGGELKPMEQLTIGLDYLMPSSGGDGTMTLEATYSLK